MRALKFLLYLLGAAFAVLYLMNPGAGVFELVPDQLPIVGHVDEAAMMALLMSCVRGLRGLRAIDATVVDESSQAVAPRAISDTIS
jgi:uncharacterized membrane protein YkvA (DUF1232 family)